MIHLGYAGREATLDGETLTLAVMGAGYVPSADDPDLESVAEYEVDTADAPGYVRASFPAAWNEGPRLDVDNDQRLAGVFDLDGATVGAYVVADDTGAIVASYPLTSPTAGFDAWPVTFPQGLGAPPDFTDILSRLSSVEGRVKDLEDAPGGEAGPISDADVEITGFPAFHQSATALAAFQSLGAFIALSNASASSAELLLGFLVADPGTDQKGINANAAGIANLSYRLAFLAADKATAAGRAASISVLPLLPDLTPTTTQFELCADFDSEDLAAHSWQTPGGFTYTTGSYLRVNGWTLLGTGLPAAPTDGQLIYSEFASRPYLAEGDPEFSAGDIQEDAAQWVWREDEGRWVPVPFYEKISSTAPTPGVEDVRLVSDFELPVGRPFDFVRWDEFDTGSGQRRIRQFLRVSDGNGQYTFDGADWILVGVQTGPAKDIVTETRPQFIGLDYGHILATSVEFRDEGPGGTLLAAPSADDAEAAGEGNPFDDPQSNTWTPGASAWVIPAP